MNSENNGGCDVLEENEILRIITSSVSTPDQLDSVDPDKLKVIASECLQGFVHNNYFCIKCNYPFVTDELVDALTITIPNPLVYLSPDDKYIPAFKRLKNPSLLCCAAKLLKYFKPKESLEDCLWAIRILIVKQMILGEPSKDIHDQLEININHLEKHLQTLTDPKSVILGYMLACQVYLWYHEVQLASKFLDKAIETSDLHIDLTGEMGKRTKYQSESKSQLKAVIIRENKQTDMLDTQDSIDDADVLMRSCELPQNVNLMDDTLLTKVTYDNDSDITEINLREEEEAILCGKISYLITASGSQDEMVREQASVYIDYLADHCKVWSVAYKCLYLRSLLEIEKPRKVERSVAQLETLVKSVNRPNCSDCSWKSHLFYPILVEPIWKTEKALADLLYSIGAIKSALDMYLQLDLWENVVNCYLRLDLRSKAETVVRRELEEGETPYLLCILGDVTRDKEHYLRAWELSNNRSFRAQKSLGDWHFFRKEYAKAIPYYNQALEINPAIYAAWSRLAYAALDTKDYPLSAKAYRRVVNFESDNFEAWNNLSKAYIKMGDKHRAFRTLLESIKCNYDEWRVWENLLLVSMDIGAFDEVIRSWHRLLDLQQRYDDGQLIEILVNSVIADIEDGEGEKTSKLIPKVQQLLGRIVAKVSASAKTWKSYAKLNLSIGEGTDKIVNCLAKSHQACMKQDNWEKRSDTTLEVLTNCDELSDLYLSVYDRCDSSDERNRFLSSFRLSLRSLLVIAERNSHYWETSQNKDAIDKLLNRLNEQTKLICSKLGIDP